MPPLWLTDRSRYLAGLQHCSMYRYLRYHSGNGYGIARKSTSMPLVTGTGVHEGLAELLELAKTGYPDRAAVKDIVNKRVYEYSKIVQERGMETAEDENLEYIIKEQSALIAALLWGWYRAMLPGLLAEYEILDIEREEILILGRVGLMSRPDFVARRKADGAVGIHDFKTTSSSIGPSMVEEYRYSVQTAMGTLAVERRINEPVSHYVIHALNKGYRKGDYNPMSGDYDGPKRQQSGLVYLYHREGNPPLVAEDYQPKWKYLGEDGKKHTLGKMYSKKAVWESLGVENWVMDTLPVEALYEHFAQIGPYERQDHLINTFVAELEAEEERWVDRLWKIENGATIASQVPRSWNCHSYYGSACEFRPVCFQQLGAEPLETGFYVPRRPHHEPEIEQMRERGLEIPPAEGESSEVE